MNRCTLSNGEIKIDFPYSPDIQTKIMSLSGRNLKECWYASVKYSNLCCLKDWGFTLDSELQKVIDQSLQKEQEVIKFLPDNLYPFQKSGVAFVETQNGKCLIADEMGCGKTIQALMWCNMHKDHKPIIILCPASLKLNWKRETEKWLTDSVEVLKGIKSYPTTKDVIIINYDILHAWIYEIKKRNPQVLILDECTAISHNSARRTKAVKRLRDTPYIIGLSGTPVMNRKKELFNILELVRPKMFPMLWNLTDISNEDLHIKLKTVMIRRLKKDVLKELPDKTYSFVPIELDNIREYQKAERDFIQFVRETKGDEKAERIRRVESLAKMEGLKQLATKGKMKQVIEWIKGVTETEKLVAFCTHTIVVDTLMNEFKAVKIDGSVSMVQRQKAVDEFQNTDVKLFIGNIRAASEGITLTASSNVALIELPWSPCAVEQCISRCDRIGQKNAVNAYYLLASGTIEERIAKLLDKKRKEITMVMDGEDTPDENLLIELMNSYK